MKLKLLVIMFLLTSFFAFAEESFNYENTYSEAIKLTTEKKYSDAEKIFKKLLQIEKRRDVYISYFNMIAWRGEFIKAANETAKYISENKPENDYELAEMEARFLFWGKDYEKAKEKYTVLQKKGFELDKNAREFLNWYINYKKFLIKYNYTNEFQNGVEDEHPILSLSCDWYKKFSMVFSYEYVINNPKIKNKIGMIEFYKDNLYLFYGQGEIAKSFYGADISLWILTLGYKNAKYDTGDVKTYKLQIDNTIGDVVLTNKIALIDDGIKISKNYMSQITYLLFKYSHYYDLDIENKGVFTVKKDENFGFLDVEAGFSRDFSKGYNGYSFGLGYRF